MLPQFSLMNFGASGTLAVFYKFGFNVFPQQNTSDNGAICDIKGW